MTIVFKGTLNLIPNFSFLIYTAPRSMGGHRDPKITTVDENKKKITIESGQENVGRENIRKYFRTKVSKEQKVVTTEHGDECCGWEEDIDYTSKVTTE